jgi:anti-sigma factor RsiW
MNCRRFAEILADYHEGKLFPDERAAVDAHLATCSGCRRLFEIACGDVDIIPEDARDALTRSILDQTSGAVCPRVETYLCDYLQNELGVEESQLVAAHLDHCDGCRSVAKDLAMMQEVLPAMAELDPGESFTHEVIEVTSRMRPSRPGLQVRLSAWWERAVQRPRFSFEMAYVGTLVLVFVLSGLVLAFREIAPGNSSSTAIQSPSKYLRSVWTETGTPVSNQVNAIAAATVTGGRAVSHSMSRLGKGCKEVSVTVLNNRIKDIRVLRQKSEGILIAFWNRLFRGDVKSEP